MHIIIQVVRNTKWYSSILGSKENINDQVTELHLIGVNRYKIFISMLVVTVLVDIVYQKFLNI